MTDFDTVIERLRGTQCAVALAPLLEERVPQREPALADYVAAITTTDGAVCLRVDAGTDTGQRYYGLDDSGGFVKVTRGGPPVIATLREMGYDYQADDKTVLPVPRESTPFA